MREQFTFYRSYYSAIKKIKNAKERLALYDAIIAYALDGETVELQDFAGAIFDLIKPTLDASRRKSENGKKGGETKANDKQSESKVEANTKQNESKIEANDKQSVSENKNKDKYKYKNECYIKEKNKKEKSDFSFPVVSDSAVLQDAFLRWLEYKKERREQYKPQGLQSLVTQIKRNEAIFGADAVANLIDECMASNWQGIIFNRLEQKREKSGNIFREIAREEGIF